MPRIVDFCCPTLWHFGLIILSYIFASHFDLVYHIHFSSQFDCKPINTYNFPSTYKIQKYVNNY